MTRLKIGDQTLDYVELTSGAPGDTPIIFIHGIISSQYTWLDFPLRFAHYGRVLTLSLPGHYPAIFPPGMTREDLTDQWVSETVAEAVRQLSGGQPAILIGHSTGGYAAIATAWRAPELVRCVISLAGFAHGSWTGILGLAQRLQYLGKAGDPLFRLMFWIITHNATMLNYSWRECSYDKAGFAANATWRKAVPLIMSDLRHQDLETLRLWFYQMRCCADLTPYLSTITVPVLALTGAQDSLVPPEEATLIGKSIPRGQALLLEGMDHASFVEQPERVYASMSAWLDRVLANEKQVK